MTPRHQQSLCGNPIQPLKSKVTNHLAICCNQRIQNFVKRIPLVTRQDIRIHHPIKYAKH